MVKEKKTEKKANYKKIRTEMAFAFWADSCPHFSCLSKCYVFFSPCDGAFLLGKISEKIKKQIFLL